ncbi:MAG: MBL fold metallo-hydrolase [Acidimicrobiia bacterium]|nr:MAG: MBL fold metallo-hydrolase [Acidimicrobiia bacterium]
MTTLTILGSSGSSPTRTNPASGYLLTSGPASIWIDAGTGTFMALAAHIDPGALSAVVISHTHVDHCSDLFGLYGYLAYGPSGTVPIPVYVPEGAAGHLSAFARAGEEHVFHTVLDVTEVAPGARVDVAGTTVRFGRAIHSVPALVTRFETGDAVVTYSGDTGPGSDLTSLADDSDLLLCEASLAGERSAHTYPYHLTAAEAGSAAKAARVRRLVLTHFATGVDPATAVVEAAVTFGRPVDSAAPGASFTIEEER